MVVFGVASSPSSFFSYLCFTSRQLWGGLHLFAWDNLDDEKHYGVCGGIAWPPGWRPILRALTTTLCLFS